MFKRRIGPEIHPGNSRPGTASANGCPDLWEMEDGSIAVIGIRKTDMLRGRLPEGAGCAPDEEIVIIPRQLLLAAKDDIRDMR